MRAALRLYVLTTVFSLTGMPAAGQQPDEIAGKVFHVAFEGSDANPGTQDRPFATLSRARDAVRGALRQTESGDITVLVHQGTYHVEEPLVLGPEEGGDGQRKVIYAAFGGEVPVISGGQPITGWKKHPDGTWTAQVPAVRSGGWQFRELFVNGRRATRARHPNDGFLRVDQVGKDRRTSFRYRDGDVHRWADMDGIELVFLHDWSISRLPIRSIDQANRTLAVKHQIGGPSPWAAMDWFEKQPRYYLENSKAFLDAPGEWFLDPNTGVVSYRPRSGETIDRVSIVAPVAEQLLVVRGDGDRRVKNVHFVGLAFEHAAWMPPEGVYWGRQAGTYWTVSAKQGESDHREADPAAVQFELAESCRFADCRVRHVGRSAIWLGRTCRGCEIVGTTVCDAGANGIMIGEGKARLVEGKPWWEVVPGEAASGNRVANCLVEQCGRELFGAVGIWVGLAGNTEIVHNEIRHVPYTGVSVGWMWWNPRERDEPRNTPSRENVVADNHIHHVMQILSDGGGIYTLGKQPGSALRGNLIHDVPTNAGRAESNGMFLDQGTGLFLIAENVIYQIARSPLRFHKGWINTVRGNYLVVGEGIPPVRYNDTKQERIELVNNRVVDTTDEIEQAIERTRRTAGIEPKYRERLGCNGESGR